MRVALSHLRCARVGGAETSLNKLAAHLCDAGHDVTVLCRTHEGPPHPRASMVELRRRAFFARGRIRAFAEDVARHLGETSYDVVVGLGRTWTQDVLHLDGGCHAAYLELAHAHVHTGARRLLERLGSKHGTILEIEARALAPGAYRCILVNSDFVRRDLVARYDVDERKVRVIRHAVDLERFHPRHAGAAGAALRRELGLDGPGPVLLFLGSGFGRKGLDLVLESLPLLRADVPDVRLLVVGRDASAARWRRAVRRLGLESVVRFAGARADAPACYGAADVFVMPSRYDAFGYSVLEALASGLPAVVSDRMGAAELVPPDAGSVVPLDSSPAVLAAALERWCAPDARAAARRAARAAAEGRGSETELAELTALLEELAATKDEDAGAHGAHAPVSASKRA